MNWKRIIKDYRDPHYFQNITIENLEDTIKDLKGFEEDELNFIDYDELENVFDVLETILKYLKYKRDDKE